MQQHPPHNLTPAEVSAEVQGLQDEFAKDIKYPYTPAEARLITEYCAPRVRAAADNGTLREYVGDEMAEKYKEIQGQTLTTAARMNTQSGLHAALKTAVDLVAKSVGLGVENAELDKRFDLENEEDVKRLAAEYEKDPMCPWTDKQMTKLMEYYGPGMQGLVKNRERAKGVGSEKAVVTSPSAAEGEKLTELTWRDAHSRNGIPVYTKLKYDPLAVSPEVKKVLDKIHKNQDYLPTAIELCALAAEFGTQDQFQAIDDSIRRRVKTNAELQEQEKGGMGSIPGYTQLSYDPLTMSSEVKRALDKMYKDPDYNPTPVELRALSVYFGSSSQLQTKDDNTRKAVKTNAEVKEGVGSITGFTTLTYDPTTTSAEVKNVLEKFEKDVRYKPTQQELAALDVHFAPEIQMCKDAGLSEPPRTAEGWEELRKSAAMKSAVTMEKHEYSGTYEVKPPKQHQLKNIDTSFSQAHTNKPTHLTRDEMVILNRLFNDCTPPIHNAGCEHLDEDGNPIEDETERIFPLTGAESAMFVEAYKKQAQRPSAKVVDEVLEGRLERMMRGFVEIGGGFYEGSEEDAEDEEEEEDSEEDVDGEPRGDSEGYDTMGVKTLGDKAGYLEDYSVKPCGGYWGGGVSRT